MLLTFVSVDKNLFKIKKNNNYMKKPKANKIKS